MEFAFALKSNRMKLYDSDLSRLKDEVKDLCEGGGKYIKLLKNIMDIDSSEALNDETSIWVDALNAHVKLSVLYSVIMRFLWTLSAIQSHAPI